MKYFWWPLYGPDPWELFGRFFQSLKPVTFLELTEGQISEKDTSLMQMLRCLLYGKHLPNTSNNSFKMLPVLGKFTGLKLPKSPKTSQKTNFLNKMSVVWGKCSPLLLWASICLQLLTSLFCQSFDQFLKMTVPLGKCSPIIIRASICLNLLTLQKMLVVLGKCSNSIEIRAFASNY